MENYKLTVHNSVVRLSDGASIPFADGNADYEQYKQWRDGWTETPVTGFDENGPIYGDPVVHLPNTPEPADVPLPPVINEITMRQARLALLQTGKLAAVNAAIALLPSPQKEVAQTEWEYSNLLVRTNPLVQMLVKMLDIDIDEMFSLASTL